MNITSDMQVFVLDKSQKKEVKKELYRNLYEMGFDGVELDVTVQEGMDSRLCDLQEAINIHNLKTIKVVS